MSILKNKYVAVQLMNTKDGKEMHWFDIYSLAGEWINSFRYANDAFPPGGIEQWITEDHFYYLVGHPEELQRLYVFSHNLKQLLNF